MKLEDTITSIRSLIFKAFDKRLSLLGYTSKTIYGAEKILPEFQKERKRINDIFKNLKDETSSEAEARKKLIDELSFTLFNRIAGIKVMEAHQLAPEIFTRREAHGGRSFGHKLWLEKYPEKANLKLEGLAEYIRYAFDGIADRIQLYANDYLYDMLPDVFDLNEIIIEFNKIDESQWQSDDILGWLYEYYNHQARKEFKASGNKIEYDKVALTSQVYTPRWVVEFILNNSLGKLWMEMHPESELKNNHDIANIPEKAILKKKSVKEILVLDTAMGSANFLLYAFDLLYEMYQEQGFKEQDIPKLIIENNLFGIDIDDRAVQIAQLGLYIKAMKRNKDIRLSQMNLVSADFYLPEFKNVKNFFSELAAYPDTQDLLKEIWNDLRLAHKFGSLIRIEEKVTKVAEKYKQPGQIAVWAESKPDFWENWSQNAIARIKEALKNYSQPGNGNGRFFKTKTLDSIVFVEILMHKFDVVVTNPPYTDSGDYGTELKNFIELNYKEPLSFYANLYAVFFKRNSELINFEAKIGMIHPLTFMYIKSFENMRTFILNNFHINIFVEYGLSDLFGAIMADPAFYVLEKNGQYKNKSVFISMNQYTRTPEENYKEQYTKEALKNYIKNSEDKNLYLLDQSKLKIIQSYPFIYWISDEFRNKFKLESLDSILSAKKGLDTSKELFIRYWWEINNTEISENYKVDNKKWIKYLKGGPYNKWYGNVWLVINWVNNGHNVKKYAKTNLRNEVTYFIEGIAGTLLSSKGPSFRYQPENMIYDSTTRSLFLKNNEDISYILGLLNSKFSNYVLSCLNSTVVINSEDLHRIPFVIPDENYNKKITELATKNVDIKKNLCTFSIMEKDYQQNPIAWIKETNDSFDPKKLIKIYLDYENILHTRIYIYEAVIDELIFQVYDLSEHDKKMVLDKEGMPVGSFPLISGYEKFQDDPTDEVKEFVKKLAIKKLNDDEKQKLIHKIESLYGSNYSLEEICKEVQINPISISQLLKESSVLPKKRMNEIAGDFLIDVVREILNEDEDGMMPLVAYAGEETVQNKVYDKLIEKGFTTAQISNYHEILGREINAFLENHFFKYLGDRLNLFMYLPKTPFIWHLSSGEYRGFETFIIIYKWSRDKLLRLRSMYVEKRESSLKNRLRDLESDVSIKAQAEKELIQKQLEEIRVFKIKIDEILGSGYDPKLDDGVGKNIAPLQEKGLLKVDVLKEKELEKYLNADW